MPEIVEIRKKASILVEALPMLEDFVDPHL